MSENVLSNYLTQKAPRPGKFMHVLCIIWPSRWLNGECSFMSQISDKITEFDEEVTACKDVSVLN